MSESFAQLFEQSLANQRIRPGMILTGLVVDVTPDVVIVNVGLKSEAVIPLEQFKNERGEIEVKSGDEVEVALDSVEDGTGETRLSREKAKRARTWTRLEEAFNKSEIVTGVITGRVKGGFTVEIENVRAFLPGSLVDVRPVRDTSYLEGKPLEFKVIKLDQKRNNVVVSRRAVVEQEFSAERSALMDNLQEGAVVKGTVKNLTDYGAFVDLGGIDGLLHITDMSWGRLTHPRDLVNVGDEIQVKVLKFDKDKQRVSLGFKQLTPDPWLDAAHRYPVGAHVKGRVISVTDYGAFVELEQGIEGLVHVTEMTWSKRMKHPSKLVNVGDQVETVVLNVNPQERRISLGMKQLETNPWESLHEKFPVGSTVEGRVRNLTDFGAFIEIEDGIDGLVHVSNLSWTKRVKHPSEVLKKGDRVKAIVLAIEPDKRRLSLGVKQLQPDVWETFFAQHHVGEVLRGKVLRVAGFGAFVEIADGVEGLCHNSEAVDANGQPMRLEPGQELDFKIIKVNPEEKKVGLSIRAVGEEASRSEVEAYKQPVSSTSSTIGELISWKRASNENN